jgi:threonine synthase
MERWADPRTYASGLCVPASIGDRLILRAIRESGGSAIAVSEREMAEGQLEMARGEGIFTAPEGGATVAAARRLVAAGEIDAGERVVLVSTGSGLKYGRVPGLRLV